MRWFKHLAASHIDEKMMEIVDRHGMAGYGLWWLTLELIAEQMDKSDRCSIKMCTKRVRKLSGMRMNHARNVYETCAKLNLLMIEIVRTDGIESYVLTCPNLLKYRDESTKRQAREKSIIPDQLRINSGAPPTPRAHLELDSDSSSLSSSSSQTKRSAFKSKEGPDKSRKPSGSHQTLIDDFHQRYLRLHDGSKPTWNGKTTALIKRLLKNHGLEECLKRLMLFEGAYTEQAFGADAFTVASFSAGFDRWVPRAKKAQIKPPSRY